MKGRHAAPGWSPFWRDILLRSVLALLLIAMAVFIWWLFSEDELFTGTVTTTSEAVTTSTATEAPTTTEAAAPTTSTTTVPTTTSTTVPTTTTTTTTTIPPPIEPAELVVKVFNANGVAGVAGRTTARFAEAGYGVSNPDNHPQFLDISRVWYREGLSREAQIIQEILVPDALVEPVPLEQEGVDIMVIVGRSFEE